MHRIFIYRKLVAPLVCAFGVVLVASIAFAQPDSAGGPVGARSAPPGTVSCFDYYTFGSVQANLTTPVSGTVSGASVTFSGALLNSNPYPVVDGTLYVKIFKARSTVSDGNGPDVVDQFVAASDIVIPAAGSVPVSFSWKVPSYAVGGDYKLATFFMTSRKSNLLGLSFTDDVVGNTVPFKVSGERTTGVSFDKPGVTVNDQSFRFAAFPPQVSSADPVVIKAKIKNTTAVAEHANVLWTVYQWDTQLRENVVQEEMSSVTIPARGEIPVSVTIKDARYPVYLAVGTLTWRDSKSIIGVRFVREGKDRLRLNFPSVMSFPLEKGVENTLFSCLNNAGANEVVSGGSLDLTLTDRDGNVIHEYRYDGDVTGAMMGVASTFTLKKNYDYVMLNARLFQGDEFVDEANLVYDCAEVDPSRCLPSDSGSYSALLDLFAQGGVMVYTSIVGPLVVLVLIVIILRRIRRSRQNFPYNPPSPPLA